MLFAGNGDSPDGEDGENEIGGFGGAAREVALEAFGDGNQEDEQDRGEAKGESCAVVEPEGAGVEEELAAQQPDGVGARAGFNERSKRDPAEGLKLVRGELERGELAPEDPEGEQRGEDEVVETAGAAKEGSGDGEGQSGGGETGRRKCELAQEGLAGEEKGSGESDGDGVQLKVAGHQIEDQEDEEDVGHLGKGPSGMEEGPGDEQKTVEVEMREEWKGEPRSPGEEEDGEAGDVRGEFRSGKEAFREGSDEAE